jgi:nucleoside phosphorylase
MSVIHSQHKETVDMTSLVDVLLVTVTDVEARTVYGLVKRKFNREPQARYVGPKTYYDLGTIGGAKTFMVRSEMGAGGPSGSLATVIEAIDNLSPSAVIMLGIAFGVDPGSQSLGDVLVSKQLVEYELQRVGTDSKGKVAIIPRGDRVSASPRLLDRFRDGELTWDVAKVRFGLILSVQKLVDNLDFRDQLRRVEREAIGGEMEGAGLYAAAHLKKVDWILAKAICDWADGKKSQDKKKHQQLAAANSAGFVFHVLERGGLAAKSPSSAEAPAGGGQVNQQATGSYIAQASGGGTATVNVTSVPLQSAHTPTAQYRTKLRQNLVDNFGDNDLRDLCFDMGVDYESLPGEGKSAKARELISFCERRGRLPDLVTKCYELRPNVAWGVA